MTNISYRSKFEIIRDILQVAEKSGIYGSKKTHIMYGANLSYMLLKRYLEKVIHSNLIIENDSYYRITDKGKSFLRLFKEYQSKLKDIEESVNDLNIGKEKLVNML